MMRLQAALRLIVVAGWAAHAVAADAQVMTPFVEPEDGRDPIITALSQATRSIDIYVFALTLSGDDPIVNALRSAAAAGVSVRAVLEPCPGESASCIPPNPEAVNACVLLTGAGVTVKWANPAFIKTHAKTTLIDGATALVTTINLEPSTFLVRRDYGLVTDDPGVIENLTRVFNQDWQSDAPISDCAPPPNRTADATVQTYASLVITPDNARASLIGDAAVPGLILAASSTLQVQVEKLDPQASRGVIPALRDTAARGVSVQVLIKEGNGSLPQADAVIAAGAEARCQSNLHAKVVIADGSQLFIGSQNLTRDSLDLRREIGWIITDPATITRFGNTFASDWAAAAPCTR